MVVTFVIPEVEPNSVRLGSEERYRLSMFLREGKCNEVNRSMLMMDSLDPMVTRPSALRLTMSTKYPALRSPVISEIPLRDMLPPASESMTISPSKVPQLARPVACAWLVMVVVPKHWPIRCQFLDLNFGITV